MCSNRFAVLSFTFLIVSWCDGSAEEAPAPRFEKDVLPLLKAKCLRCHGDKRQRGHLDLRSAASLLKGGESGKVVVPGDAGKSLLFKKVHKGEMPPTEGKQLTKQQVELIRRWIDGGAKSDSKVVATGPAVTQHDVEPLMLLRCAACHGLRKQEAALDMRTKASMLKGGKSGPAIVLGKPEESLLLKKIHSGAMPPRDRLIRSGVKPMRDDEIKKLTQWIKDGAPEVEIKPDVASTKPDPLVTDEDRQFWSFQPPRKVIVPRSDVGIANPIDAFIARKLSEKGLSFSPQADQLTLLRRVYFDLIGLPPPADVVQRFVSDTDPRAYEKLIERLLASPRYGERWGRYWLDLVGYADSEGKRSADPIRPHAWRYRDYVIRSFNENKPYARFLLEQLAGDELADYRNAETITPAMMDNLVATGFLRMAPDGTGSDIVNFVPERIEVISDQLQVLGSSVLGLTVHCARCHSHKYDPIPHRDYYRLVAVFKGAYDEHDWLKPSFVRGQTKAKAPGRVLSIVSEEAKAEWAAYKKRLEAEIAELKKQQKSNRTALLTLKSLEPILEQEPSIRALWDRGEPSPTYVYRRGDYLQPSRLVGPGVPSVLTDGKTPLEVQPPYPDAKSSGRRLAFAKWLTQPEHPLTSRVMVNRIWNHHFGQGIVKSLSNFGKTGAKPTHPDLLDWLARAFVQRGWSIKAMHRLMMTSRTYRQSSQVTEQHEKLDPENALLSRMPLQRMEAEVLRDSLIYVAGQLNESPFGPSDPVIARKDGLVTSIRGKNGWRRSIYVRQRRSQIPTLLENFDLPQMNPNCVSRVDSTVASQALHLMNNAMIEELAGYFAKRILREDGDDQKQQIKRVYLVALSRTPTEDETNIGLRALQGFRAHWSEHLASIGEKREEDVAQRALASYCHVLLNSAAFVHVD